MHLTKRDVATDRLMSTQQKMYFLSIFTVFIVMSIFVIALLLQIYICILQYLYLLKYYVFTKLQSL